MTRPRVYLAGPISGQTHREATSWRDNVAARLAPEIEAVSPMRGKDYLRNYGVLGGTSSEPYMAAHAMSAPKGIIHRDRYDVRTADAVFMYLGEAGRVSIGTMIEAGWADAWRVPVILVAPDNDPYHSHAMLDEIAGWKVPTLDEGIHIVRALFNVGPRMGPSTPLGPTPEERTAFVFDRGLLGAEVRERTELAPTQDGNPAHNS